ncbi:hypothetical protein [Streptomyces sp. NPDC005423]|uniref:hypothetical protein n=1 Tax=Streptomyces sp. NPDC005423 TaxID=3155343 RepID=UPI0033A6B723
MNWNFKENGGREPKPGLLPDAWHEGYAFLNHLGADWIGMPELPHAQTHPYAPEEEVAAAKRRFNASQDLLGMRCFLGGMGEGNNPTGAFIRERHFTIGLRAQRHHRTGFRTPPTQITLGLDKAPGVPIITAVFHNSYCSPPARQTEAFNLTGLVDKVKADQGTAVLWAACWLLGDTNESPSPLGELVGGIDWPTVTDLVHRSHRAQQLPDGSWRSYTDFDDIMFATGMHDAARWAAHQGQFGAMAATAGRARPDQGGAVRLDRNFMDPFTVQAVENVHVIDMSGLSDHDLTIYDLSLHKLIETLHRQTVQPLAPWSADPLLPRPLLSSRNAFRAAT